MAKKAMTVEEQKSLKGTLLLYLAKADVAATRPLNDTTDLRELMGKLLARLEERRKFLKEVYERPTFHNLSSNEVLKQIDVIVGDFGGLAVFLSLELLKRERAAKKEKQEAVRKPPASEKRAKRIPRAKIART